MSRKGWLSWGLRGLAKESRYTGALDSYRWHKIPQKLNGWCCTWDRAMWDKSTHGRQVTGEQLSRKGPQHKQQCALAVRKEIPHNGLNTAQPAGQNRRFSIVLRDGAASRLTLCWATKHEKYKNGSWKGSKVGTGLAGISCEERLRTLGCPAWRRGGQVVISLLLAASWGREAEGAVGLCSWELMAGHVGMAQSRAREGSDWELKRFL